VAVGAPGETVDGTRFTGGVYLFRRASNGTWTLHSTLRAPESFPGQLGNSFGYSVEITEDGATLKVNSSLPRGEDDAYEGRTHIYDFNGTTWQRTATVGPAFPGYYCSFVRMSGDGTTLTSMCFLYPSQEFRLTTRKRSGNAWVLVGDQLVALTGAGIDQMSALSFDGNSVAMKEGSEPETRTLTIYRWDGNSWVRESMIPQPPGLIWHEWGYRAEFSRNARRVVIGSQHRAVVVYERTGNTNDPWRQVPIVMPVPDRGGGFAGRAISLSGSGYYLAVGSPGEDSNATGIDGDRYNISAENAGAVWLY